MFQSTTFKTVEPVLGKRSRASFVKISVFRHPAPPADSSRMFDLVNCPGQTVSDTLRVSIAGDPSRALYYMYVCDYF